MFLKFHFYLRLILLTLILTSCGTTPTIAPPTPLPPQPTSTLPAPTPTSHTLPKTQESELIPAGTVRAYPGPEHYAGDVLTFEIENEGSFDDETISVSMTLDNRIPIKVSGTTSFLSVVLPEA